MKLLKFYTPACVHCPKVSEFLENNKIEHESINLFDYPEKSIQYRVLGVPTLMVVDDEGKEITRHVGGKNYEVFLEEQNFLTKGE